MAGVGGSRRWPPPLLLVGEVQLASKILLLIVGESLHGHRILCQVVAVALLLYHISYLRVRQYEHEFSYDVIYTADRNASRLIVAYNL